MDNLNTPKVAVSESKPPINEMSTEVKESNKKRKTNILILVLVFIILLLAGVISYLFFTDKIDTSFLNNATHVEEENLDEDTDNEVVDENEDIEENVNTDEEDDTENEIILETKDYYNSTQGVKFKYPSNWKIEKEITNESGFYVSFSENTSNPDFIFEYNLPAASGPEVCYFSDTNNPEDGVLGTLFDNYITIDESDTLRRTYRIFEDTESYKICKRRIPSIFVDWMDSGYISYTVKMSRSDSNEIIKLMDKILLSFEYTGDIGV